jgi:DNA-binding CsgD family transcriptional regulator
VTPAAGRWTAVTSRVEGAVGWVVPNHAMRRDAGAVTRQALEAVQDHVVNPDVQAVVLADFGGDLTPHGATTDDPSLVLLCQKVMGLIGTSSTTLVLRPMSSDRGSVSSHLPCYTEPLTHRELQVLSLWCDGLSARDVGDRLFISERTVETHVSNGYRKLGINSRIELIKRAAAFGL